jgi:ribonucleotide reductase alpha subunit
MVAKSSEPKVKNGLLPTPAIAKGMPKAALTDNARQVLTKRYVRRGDDGKPAENVEEMFWRVAYHVAKVEEQWGADVAARTVEYYHLLSSKKFFPNSPTFTGAGTPLGQLAACFVLPITDDMGRHSAGIFQTLRDAALIQQTGGGNGFSFSRLRPKGALVQTSAGQATGPVGFLRVYDHAFGEIAQGGCLLPDTLVFTNKGLLRLDEIVDSETSGWQEHQLSVPTDEGVKDSPRGYNNGIADVLRVHTREGVSITGTPNHKVKVMTNDGPQWREIQDLAQGDWILVRLGEHAGKLQVLKKPTQKHGNQVMPDLPSVLDEEFAFFLGYLAGDGFMAKSDVDHRVGVSVAHSSYLMEEMPVMLERLFNVNVHKMQKPNDRSVTFVMDNRAVKEFLSLNGLQKQGSRDVAVPRLIRQSPQNIVGAYLRGLFEADGTLTHGYPNLGTSSARLAREVSTLLIGLGCPVQMRTVSAGLDRWGDSDTYHIKITSTVGLQAWREKIGCDQRSRFVSAYAWESDQRRESSYVLPNSAYWLQPILDEITVGQIDRRGRGKSINFRSTEPRLRRQVLRYMRDDRNFTRSGYELLKQKYSEAFENAPSVDGLWFVEVRGVEEAGQSLTLDLEVEDNHTYLAYGMVTHNTRRGANMAVLRVDHPDVEDFITCKINENQITNFNISVGITDAFMQAVKEDKEWALRFPDLEEMKHRGFSGTIEQAEAAGITIHTYKTVNARELFNKIVKQAHHNGEPGVLFLDAANRYNPVPHLYPLEATNPCHRGTNLVHTDMGPVPIKDLVGFEFQALTSEGDFARATAYPTGIKPLFRVHLNNGYTIDLTENHNLIMSDGSKCMVRDMKTGDEVKLSKHVVMPQMELAGIAETASQRTFVQDNVSDFISEDFAVVTLIEDLHIVEEVYNLTVDHPDHQFAVNGIISANCGEQWLGPYENCCLGSVNLNEHCGPDGTVDWVSLRQSVVTSTRFLDDVVEANAYVPAVAQLKEAAHRARRIGLGIMGLADLMYHAGVRYGSQEGQEFGAQVMEFVRYHSMKTSVELAEERGPFPAIVDSIYDMDNMTWEAPKALANYQHNWNRPEVKWEAIVSGIKSHGIRNAAQTTVAPTGTIATVAGCEGYGCEPVFALAYIRHVNDNGKDLKLTYASPRFDEALKKLGLGEEKRQEIVERVMNDGTCQNIAELPQSVRDTFVVSADITAEEHVRMQGALQAFVDNSLSKTVNFHENATEDDVSQAYMMAWELGCKGITVYVTGSRDVVVLETKATADKKVTPLAAPTVVPAQAASPTISPTGTMWHGTKKSRPKALTGRTHSIETPVGKAFITINENGGEQPFEAFVNTAKAGSEIAAVSEAIGRLISYILRMASPVAPVDRMREIIAQLVGIGGGRSLGFGINRVRSLPDGIGQVLDQYLNEKNGVVAEEVKSNLLSGANGGNGHHNEPASPAMKIGDICPECGEAAVVNEEGCRKCYACGFSEC